MFQETHLILAALVAAAIAGVCSNALMPAAARLAQTLNAIDHPGGRKDQPEPVPRLGGVAIIAGLLIGVAVVMVLSWGEWASYLSRPRVFALGLGTFLVFLAGVIDDLIGMTIWKKFSLQIIAASLLVGSGWTFSVLSLPFFGEVELGLLSKVIVVLFIVGVTNAINLLDGLDGLAGGVVAIIAVSMLIYAIFQGHPGTVVLMGATAGACLGFLRHNWAPARIFMGDSGSLTLGFLLAAASTYASIKKPAAVAILVPLLALGLPVFDTLLVMVVRFWRNEEKRGLGRRLRTMFQADRNHIHHVMGSSGASRPRIVMVLYTLVLLFCATAIIVALSQNFRLGLTMVGVEFVVVMLIRGLAHKRGLAAEARLTAESEVPLATPVALVSAEEAEPPRIRRVS